MSCVTSIVRAQLVNYFRLLILKQAGKSKQPRVTAQRQFRARQDHDQCYRPRPVYLSKINMPCYRQFSCRTEHGTPVSSRELWESGMASLKRRSKPLPLTPVSHECQASISESESDPPPPSPPLRSTCFLPPLTPTSTSNGVPVSVECIPEEEEEVYIGKTDARH